MELDLKRSYQIINHILLKDSKSSTYKYALLRATIEVLREAEQQTSVDHKWRKVSLFLICEKWMYYYLPFVQYDVSQNSGSKIAFHAELKALLDLYKEEYNTRIRSIQKKFRDGIETPTEKEIYLKCFKKIADTIIKNPMKHIGFSFFGEEYQLYTKRPLPRINTLLNSEQALYRSDLLSHFGDIEIRSEVGDSLSWIGHFIIGDASILKFWAKTTLNFKNNTDAIISYKGEKVKLEEQHIFNWLDSLSDQRSVDPPRKYYEYLQKGSNLYCIWTGKLLKDDFETDHIIPFSYWKNNDIWNLMPSDSRTNLLKSDKIPNIDRLEKAKPYLLKYWTLLHEKFGERFEREIAMTFNVLPEDITPELLFERLSCKCQFLIDEMEFEGW